MDTIEPKATGSSTIIKVAVVVVLAFIGIVSVMLLGRVLASAVGGSSEPTTTVVAR